MKDTTKNITMWLRPQECTEPSTDLDNYHSKQQPEMHHIENFIIKNILVRNQVSQIVLLNKYGHTK